MTTQTLWIVVAVVAAILIIAAVVTGVVLRNRRRISLRAPEQLDESTTTEQKPPRRGGSYRAEGSFDFSPGSGAATVERPRKPETPAPPVADDAVATTPVAPVDDAAATAPVAPVTDDAVATAPVAPVTREPVVAEPVVIDPAGPAVAEPILDGPVVKVPVEETPVAEGPAVVEEPDVVPVVVDPADPAAAAHATAGTGVPAEPITEPGGRLERLRGQLSRSRSGFGQGLLGILGGGDLDEESWEDVEATLLQADLGPEMTQELVDALREKLAVRAVRTPDQARAVLRDVLVDALSIDADRSVRALPHDGRPAVLLVVGVNGTGKTTTTGKLARVLVAGGHQVVLGAADTFRAAAAEQLVTWGERSGATVVRGPEGADPASVAFDAVKQAANEGADAVLLDTAGRLHTKTGLMDELNKVKRVVERQAEVDEVLLVLDATTGQNGLTQARVFGDVVKVTGIVLTKLDGTAKGGIVFRVQRELGVPVKLVGLGEGPDDLAPFEAGAYIDALLN